MKLISIILIVMIPALSIADDCDCKRFAQIRTKPAQECTIEEQAIVNNCLNECNADGTVKERKIKGKGWLIAGIIITGVVILSAVKNSNK